MKILMSFNAFALLVFFIVLMTAIYALVAPIYD